MIIKKVKAHGQLYVFAWGENAEETAIKALARCAVGESDAVLAPLCGQLISDKRRDEVVDALWHIHEWFAIGWSLLRTDVHVCGAYDTLASVLRRDILTVAGDVRAGRPVVWNAMCHVGLVDWW